MSDYNSRIAEAIQTLQLASEMSLKYYHKPLIICYSGGKDSDVLLDLTKRADIPFEVLNSHTTVDAPETVYHIREVFSQFGDKKRITTENGQRADVYGGVATILYPKETMWELIVKNGMPPTRLVRYCCRQLKETSVPNRMVATGVRKAESNQRSSRNSFELRSEKKENRIPKTFEDMQSAYEDALFIQSELKQTDNDTNAYDCLFIEKAKQNKDTVCNAIINLTNEDVWFFIKENSIEICELYYKGKERLGCIGCPMAGKGRNRHFVEYPTYKKAYMKAFEKMLTEREKKGKSQKWESAEDVFEWWMESKTNKDQITIEQWLESEKKKHIKTITI